MALDLTWRKSSRSTGNGGACVEVRLAGNQIQLRDTKTVADGPVNEFNHEEWLAFVEGVKAGEFDLPASGDGVGHQRHRESEDLG